MSLARNATRHASDPHLLQILEQVDMLPGPNSTRWSRYCIRWALHLHLLSLSLPTNPCAVAQQHQPSLCIRECDPALLLCVFARCFFLVFSDAIDVVPSVGMIGFVVRDVQFPHTVPVGSRAKQGKVAVRISLVDALELNNAKQPSRNVFKALLTLENMDAEEVLIQKISDVHPGYKSFITHLTTLASTYLPPFIYVTDTNNPRITTSVIDAIFHDASSIPGAPPTLYARVNPVACLTPRVFYDTVLNALAEWRPSWENGCQVWPGDDSQRYNESIDSFLHGLRRLRLERTGDPSKRKGKGKAKAVASENERDPSMVILIERAERLSEGLPELIVPLSRLGELVSRLVSLSSASLFEGKRITD
jgi:hypothetical protein